MDSWRYPKHAAAIRKIYVVYLTDFSPLCSLGSTQTPREMSGYQGKEEKEDVPRKTWMEGVRAAMKPRHLEADQWLTLRLLMSYIYIWSTYS